jgi:hypothetical protein
MTSLPWDCGSFAEGFDVSSFFHDSTRHVFDQARPMAPDKTVTVVTVWDDAVWHHVIPVTLVACSGKRIFMRALMFLVQVVEAWPAVVILIASACHSLRRYPAPWYHRAPCLRAPGCTRKVSTGKPDAESFSCTWWCGEILIET